jgi:DNA mismatch endonuclease (patch repair protein)
MSRIHGKNTKPEMLVRSLLHRLGYRFRLHDKSLPGRPDIVFTARKKVIFVHGCFWHQHSGCRLARIPSTNSEFWRNKLSGNCCRDENQQIALAALGWQFHVIWECEMRDFPQLERRIEAFLGNVRIKKDATQADISKL